MLRARDGLGADLAGSGRYISQPMARSLFIDQTARADAQRLEEKMDGLQADVVFNNVMHFLGYF